MMFNEGVEQALSLHYANSATMNKKFEEIYPEIPDPEELKTDFEYFLTPRVINALLQDSRYRNREMFELLISKVTTLCVPYESSKRALIDVMTTNKDLDFIYDVLDDYKWTIRKLPEDMITEWLNHKQDATDIEFLDIFNDLLSASINISDAEAFIKYLDIFRNCTVESCKYMCNTLLFIITDKQYDMYGPIYNEQHRISIDMFIEQMDEYVEANGVTKIREFKLVKMNSRLSEVSSDYYTTVNEYSYSMWISSTDMKGRGWKRLCDY